MKNFILFFAIPLLVLPFTFTNAITIQNQPDKYEYSKDKNGYLVTVNTFWTKEKIEFLINQSLYPKIIYKLIKCESDFRSIDRMDSNNKYSYGVLQIQADTWKDWSKKSGIKGSPRNADDAIEMASWAIKNGYLNRWSCAKIQKLL